MMTKRKFPDPDGRKIQLAKARAESIAASVEQYLAGFEGNPPVTEKVRDIDGEGKREILREHRYDPIEHLHKRGVIHKHQFDAARQLQADADRAALRSRSSMDGVPKVASLYVLSDAQMRAMAEHADALKAVRKALEHSGSLGEIVLRLVVIENKTLHDAAQIMREDHRAVSTGLRFALDCLARHYGLA